MSIKKCIKIEGMGRYLPQQVLSSELEEKHGIPLGWSEKYSGVKKRHHVTFETNGYMGARAIEDALEKCNLSLSEIDLIISAGATYDYSLPNQSCIIKSELKDGHVFNTPTMDIDTSCLSFISAFEVANSLFDGDKYKRIIIVTSEISSKGLDSNNRETITLFGDAAVAAILQYDEESEGHVFKSNLKTYSEGAYDSIIKGGGNKYHFKDHPYDQKLFSFSMNGKKMIKMVKQKLPEFVGDFFSETPFSIEDIDVIIPHQASKLGKVIINKLYNFKKGRLKENLDSYGNCIAASIPLLLYSRRYVFVNRNLCRIFNRRVITCILIKVICLKILEI